MPPDIARPELFDHSLIVEVQNGPRPLVFHVVFKVWDPSVSVPKYSPVASAPVTIVWTDTGGVEHDVTDFVCKTNLQGVLLDQATNLPPVLPNVRSLGRTLTSMHFVIGGSSGTGSLRTILAPACDIDRWSTKGWFARDGITLGNFFPAGGSFGTQAQPVMFDIGAKYDLQFLYWDRKKIKRNFPIGVQLQFKIKKNGTSVTKLLTVSKGARFKGVLFDVAAESDVDLELIFQTAADTAVHLLSCALTLPYLWGTNDLDKFAPLPLKEVSAPALCAWPALKVTSLSNGTSSVVLNWPKYVAYNTKDEDLIPKFSVLTDPDRKALLSNFALATLANYRIFNLAIFYLLDFLTTAPTAWQGLPLLDCIVSGDDTKTGTAATGPDLSDQLQNDKFQSTVLFWPKAIIKAQTTEFHEFTHALVNRYLITRDDFTGTSAKHSFTSSYDIRTAYLEGFADFIDLLFRGPDVAIYAGDPGNAWWKPFEFQYGPQDPQPTLLLPIWDSNNQTLIVSFPANDGEKVEGTFALSLYLIFYYLVMGKTNEPPTAVFVASESGDGDVYYDPSKNAWLTDSDVQTNFKKLIWDPAGAAAFDVGAGTTHVVAKMKAAADVMTSASYPGGIRHRMMRIMNEFAIGVEELKLTTIGAIAVSNDASMSSVILKLVNAVFNVAVGGGGFVEGMRIELVSTANPNSVFLASVDVVSHTSLNFTCAIPTPGNYNIRLTTRWGKRVVTSVSGAAVKVQ